MIYRGYFRDIKDILYKVEIVTDNDTSIEGEELIFTSKPVTIKYTSNNEDAYKPYKCSSATISLLLREVNFDFNNAFANRVKISIYEGDKVIWCGYATPNAYSQSFDNYLDLYELDAQDGLSTLQYFKYNYIEPYGTFPTELNSFYGQQYDSFISNRNYATNFLHILTKLNQKLNGMYKTIYVTDNIVVEGLTELSCLDAIFIDEKNFFDEDGEPWDCLSVLEEICKYCGITCFAYGDELYFLNQDAICGGFNNYFKYSYTNNKLVYDGKVELKDEQEINIDSFSRNGTTLTLDSVYNKVSVKDDLYSVDTLNSSIEDDEYWVESVVTNWREPNQGLEYKWDDNTFTNSVRSDNTIILRVDKDDVKKWVQLKHYGYNWTKDVNKRYIFRYYDSNGSELQNLNTKNFTYGYTRQYNGCEIVNYGISDVEDWSKPHSSPDMKTAILFHNPNLQTSKPMFECITDNYIFGANDIIVINGKMTFSKNTNILPFIDYNNDDTKMAQGFSFLNCKLQVGNKWLSSTYGSNTFTWSDTETGFQLPFEFKKDTKAFNTAFNFRNTANTIFGLKENGFAVTCPTNGAHDLTANKIKFTILTPYAPEVEFNQGQTHASLLEDFDIKVYHYGDENVNDKEDNTEITNTIENNAVEEFDTINLKICTDDDKRLNLSKTMYLKGIARNSTRSYISSTFVNDDVIIEDPLFGNNKISNMLRYGNTNVNLIFGKVTNIYNRAKMDFFTAEQNIICNIAEQYNSPTLNIECNLYKHLNLKPYSLLTYPTQFPNKKFCIDSISYDLGNNSTKVKLIHKKDE